MRRSAILVALSFALAPAAAFAEDPAAKPAKAPTEKAEEAVKTDSPKTAPEARPVPKKRVIRRAEKLSAAKSEASRKSKVEVLERIDVVGRRQLPMAITDISRVEPEFQTGTARYSERDRPFLKKKEAPRAARPKRAER